MLRISSRNARFQQWEALLGNRGKRQRAGEFLVQGVRPITLAAGSAGRSAPCSTTTAAAVRLGPRPAPRRARAPGGDGPGLLAELGEKAKARRKLIAVVEAAERRSAPHRGRPQLSRRGPRPPAAPVTSAASSAQPTPSARTVSRTGHAARRRWPRWTTGCDRGRLPGRHRSLIRWGSGSSHGPSGLMGSIVVTERRHGEVVSSRRRKHCRHGHRAGRRPHSARPVRRTLRPKASAERMMRRRYRGWPGGRGPRRESWGRRDAVQYCRRAARTTANSSGGPSPFSPSSAASRGPSPPGARARRGEVAAQPDSGRPSS